jgi:hypothetical protein
VSSSVDSPNYMQENCWFFASTVQEVLMRRFGGQYESGFLNHPTLSAESRGRVRDLTYSHLAEEIDRKSGIILRFADLITDPAITKAIKALLNVIKSHQVRESSVFYYSP